MKDPLGVTMKRKRQRQEVVAYVLDILLAYTQSTYVIPKGSFALGCTRAQDDEMGSVDPHPVFG